MVSIDFASPKAVRTASLVFAGVGVAQGLFFLFGMRSGSPHALHDGVMLAGGIALLAAGFALLHEKRAIENIPRSRVRSVAIGFVELTGAARARTPVIAPLSGIACVFYRFQIEQEESGGRGGPSWKTIDQGQSADWFDLDDGTGAIAIDPDGVQVELGRDYRSITPGEGLLARRQRCSEWRVLPGETITVVGTVRALRNLAQERQEAVHDRLVALKRDPARLRAFDADHDGRISTEEWGNAVRVVQDETVRAAAVAPAPIGPDLLLGRGEAETTFVITDQGQRGIVRTLSIKAGIALAAGAALTVAGALSLFARPGAAGAGIPW
jgi:hypothetical protein